MNKSNKKSLEYGVVKKDIENKGYTLLSTEYVSLYSPLEVICPKGHKYITSYERIKNSKNGGCEICKKNDKSKIMATSYSDVYKHIDSLGYIYYSHLKVNIKVKKKLQKQNVKLKVMFV